MWKIEDEIAIREKKDDGKTFEMIQKELKVDSMF